MAREPIDFGTLEQFGVLIRALQATTLVLVLATTLAPRDPAPHLFDGQDKFEHVLAFMVLGVLFCRGARGWSFWLGASATAVLAVLIEGLQAEFVQTRVASAADAVAGVSGTAIGAILAAAVNASKNAGAVVSQHAAEAPSAGRSTRER